MKFKSWQFMAASHAEHVVLSWLTSALMACHTNLIPAHCAIHAGYGAITWLVTGNKCRATLTSDPS
ncbi:TPA: hypothetical protein ACX6RA_003553 [Photobacterium damselae]